MPEHIVSSVLKAFSLIDFQESELSPHTKVAGNCQHYSFQKSFSCQHQLRTKRSIDVSEVKLLESHDMSDVEAPEIVMIQVLVHIPNDRSHVWFYV